MTDSIPHTSSSDTGKQIRLNRILGSGWRTLMVPLDDALISGPIGRLSDSAALIDDIINAGCDSVLAFSGSLSLVSSRVQIGRVLNVTASTIRTTHTKKVVVSSVERAVRMGADGIAVHVNVGSRFESEMLSTLGTTCQSADRDGMPVVAIMYPRTEDGAGDNNFDELYAQNPAHFTDLVSHACRIGQELGADIIKTQYTGTPESFSRVVQCSYPVPILVAGGKQVEPLLALERAYGVLEAGGSGVSFGRNIHQRNECSTLLLKALCGLMHRTLSLDEAKDLVVNFAGRGQ